MLRIFLLVVYFTAVLVSVGQTQLENAPAPAGEKSPRWTSKLEAIRADVDRIVEENNRLQAEYNVLKERIVDIQTSINTYKVENQKIEADITRTRKLIGQEQLTRDSLSQKLERLRQEGSVSKAKVDALKDQLANHDEKLRLWTMQVQDLELEKQQLDMELQSQQQFQKDLESGQAEELKKLNEEVAAAQSKAAEAESSATGAVAQNEQTLQEIRELDAENKLLEQKIVELEKEKESQAKGNEEWRKKMSREGMSDEYVQKLKEKRGLESEIAKLEGQLANVRKTVEESAETQTKRRGLLDQIMTLDKENRELRKKIADLKAKMANVQLDPAKFNQ